MKKIIDFANCVDSIEYDNLICLMDEFRQGLDESLCVIFGTYDWYQDADDRVDWHSIKQADELSKLLDRVIDMMEYVGHHCDWTNNHVSDIR